MPLLTDKVAIVTGASSGIGRAAALLFAREGARLVLAGRREEALRGTAAAIGGEGGEAVVLAGDLRDEHHARELVELATARFGGLDVAFNNAGAVGDTAPLAELASEQWHTTLDTNLTAAFLAARHQAPALVARGGGALLFTGSFVGCSAGMPGMGAYAAAKAGLLGLVRTLAVELAGQGVRVNALLPGGTDTPGASGAVGTPEARAFVEGLHALKRLARPEEIARSALYLVSDHASFVTGTALFADGGVSIART